MISLPALRIKYQELPLHIKAAAWYFICNILQKGISLFTVPLYTRLLTTAQYGAYQVFLSWLEIFEILTTFRLSWGGFSVGLTKFPEKRDRYTASIQCMSITTTTSFFLLYLLFAKYIDTATGLTRELTLMIFILAYTTPAIEFWSVRQRVEGRYRAVVTISLLDSFLIPILGLCTLFLTNWGENGVIIARVVVQGLTGIILFSANCHKDFVFFDRTYWGRAMRFNIPLVPHYLSTVILNSSDRIMIERIVGSDKAGIYGVAYSAAMVMSLLNGALTSSMQPWFFQRLRNQDYRDIDKVINISLILVAGANLLLIGFAPEAITILAPPVYQEAIWIVPPLASSAVVMFFYQHFLNTEFYYENSKMITLASLGAAVLNVALNFWLIPVFGYLIAGYTTLFSYFFFAVTHYIFMRKLLKKEKCSNPIVDIRGMLLILGGFFVLAAILGIGYKLAILRYGLLLVILSVFIVKRSTINSFLK